jgi:hypothetical protein
MSGEPGEDTAGREETLVWPGTGYGCRVDDVTCTVHSLPPPLYVVSRGPPGAFRDTISLAGVWIITADIQYVL